MKEPNHKNSLTRIILYSIHDFLILRPSFSSFRYHCRCVIFLFRLFSKMSREFIARVRCSVIVVFKHISLSLVFGIVCAFGEDCNTTIVSQCYSSLVHYEGLMFPLYGDDEAALDETCRAINESFDCTNAYVAACHEQPECDDKCKEMIIDIGVFALNTGVRDLQSELCNPGSPIRETYLENYVCLEDNWNHYATCHNDSQLSQEFMSTLTDPHEGLDARCCFFSWYRDCFTNITRDTCGVNATFFVSFSLHKLIGHIAEHLCKDNPITCARPPLPPEDGLDKDETDNDIDNSLDSSANSHYLLSLSSLFITLCCAVISKYVFLIN